MPGPGIYFYGDEERKEVEEVLSTGYLSRFRKDDDPNFKQKSLCGLLSQLLTRFKVMLDIPPG